MSLGELGWLRSLDTRGQSSEPRAGGGPRRGAWLRSPPPGSSVGSEDSCPGRQRSHSGGRGVVSACPSWLGCRRGWGTGLTRIAWPGPWRELSRAPAHPVQTRRCPGGGLRLRKRAARPVLPPSRPRSPSPRLFLKTISLKTGWLTLKVIGQSWPGRSCLPGWLDGLWRGRAGR